MATTTAKEATEAATNNVTDELTSFTGADAFNAIWQAIQEALWSANNPDHLLIRKCDGNTATEEEVEDTTGNPAIKKGPISQFATART